MDLHVLNVEQVQQESHCYELCIEIDYRECNVVYRKTKDNQKLYGFCLPHDSLEPLMIFLQKTKPQVSTLLKPDDFIGFDQTKKIAENFTTNVTIKNKYQCLVEHLRNSLKSGDINSHLKLPDKRAIETGIQRGKFDFLRKASSSKYSLIKINFEDELYNSSFHSRLPQPNSRFGVVSLGSEFKFVCVSDDGLLDLSDDFTTNGETIYGLAKLLFEAKTFDEIFELSNKGNQRVADIFWSDAIPKSSDDASDFYTKTQGDLPIFPFGKITDNTVKGEVKREDLAASFFYKIVYDTTKLIFLKALQAQIDDVFVCGNFSKYDATQSEMTSIFINANIWQCEFAQGKNSGPKIHFLKNESLTYPLSEMLCS